MVKFVRIIFCFGLLSLSISSCYVLTQKNLNLKKEPYSGNQIKTNGYYYLVGKNGDLYPSCFFYNDGTLFAPGGNYPKETIDNELKMVLNPEKLINYYQKSLLHWGVFQIEGEDIRFERWYPSSGGASPLYVRAGKIINDTTFIITKSYMIKNGSERNISSKNEIYHFKEYMPKPDSTNIFVK